MGGPRGTNVTGTGSYLPARVLDNAEISAAAGIAAEELGVRATSWWADGRLADALLRPAGERAGATPDQVELVDPHQANLRIIEGVKKEMRIPHERVFVNIDRYGNTGAATIPIALDEALREGRVRRDRPTLLVSFGAGATAGAVVLGPPPQRTGSQ